MKRFALAFLLVPMLKLVASAQSEPGMGTLAVIVPHSGGKLVAGASVRMPSSTGDNPHATKMNAPGRFSLPELVHGYYDVRASNKGAATEWKRNFEVRTGKQTAVTLRLSSQETNPVERRLTWDVAFGIGT
jgi:hypothetical protein